MADRNTDMDEVVRDNVGEDYFLHLLRDARDIFMEQPVFIDLDEIEKENNTGGKTEGGTWDRERGERCFVIGDIHGDLNALRKALSTVDALEKRGRRGFVVFLGDVVDRGPHQVECLVEVLQRAISQPGRVFFLRGNHETRDVNSYYGFLSQLKHRFGHGNGTLLWEEANKTFECLPVAAKYCGYFLVHGGITPEIPDLDTLRRFPKEAAREPDEKLLGLLWNDPGPAPHNKNKNTHSAYETRLYETLFSFNTYRGCYRFYSPEAVEIFCRKNSLHGIIRAHQCVNGASWTGRVLTVFSVPNYCGNRYGGVAFLKKRREKRTGTDSTERSMDGTDGGRTDGGSSVNAGEYGGWGVEVSTLFFE